MLRIVVLGSAAGGGVPQWNCGCPVCRAARGDQPELRSTQCSIAISGDGDHWFLINASPDLRQQLVAARQLHPKAGQLRHSPIAGVILTNGEVDAVAGLLSMREGSPFTIHAHPTVLAILKANSIFNVLSEANVKRVAIAIEEPFEPRLPDGTGSGIEILPFAVPGKVAWYLRDKSLPGGRGDELGDTLGLRIRDKKTDKYVVFLAACAHVTDELKARLVLPDLPAEGSYHTLAGLVLALLRRVPRVGDRIVFSGWRFEVLEMDGRRVDKVLASREPSVEA